MIDKEQIKDFMRNCSEGQYKYLKWLGFNKDRVCYFITVRYVPEEEISIREFRMGIKYDKHNTNIATEFFFLSEKDEEDYFLNGIGYDHMTPELGKYYLNKYSFLKLAINEKTPFGIQYQVYNQKKVVLYWYE